MCSEKDTVDDASSLDVPALREMKLNEFPKATGVVVVDCLAFPNASMMGLQKRWICMCTWKCLGCVCVFRNVFYLLCTMACSTRVLFSVGGVPAVFWLMTDRNCNSSLVLSVFPAPLSPLVNTHAHIHLHLHFTFSHLADAFIQSYLQLGNT